MVREEFSIRLCDLGIFDRVGPICNPIKNKFQFLKLLQVTDFQYKTHLKFFTNHC